MAHLLDPKAIPDDTSYAAAQEELDRLVQADPHTPGGRRCEELTLLIEEYEARRDGYDLARLRALLRS
jgi:hypothetical protein